MYVKVVIAQNDTDLPHIKLFINVSKCFMKAQHGLTSSELLRPLHHFIDYFV